MGAPAGAATTPHQRPVVPRSLNLTASSSADLELMRASMLLDSDPVAAARRAGDILAATPGHAGATLLLATARRRLGDPAAAAALLESLSATDAGSPFMLLELGRAYAADGRGAAARAALGRAVALDAGLADAWRELAAQLFAAGETRAGDEADARYRVLLREPPELADARLALADNRLSAAEAVLRRFVQQASHQEVVLRMLAEIAVRREDQAEAERCLTQSLALAPGYAAARHDLAQLLFAQQRITELLPLVERLLGAEPDNAEYLTLKAAALRLVGRNVEALALAERAVAGHPDNDQAWVFLGHLLREGGQQTRAIEMLRRALTVRPGCGRAYSSLANLKTFRFDERDREAMRAELARAADVEDRLHLEFALGKALEDEGEFAASFEHYARGNALQRASIFYDADTVSAEMRRHQAFYSSAFFAERAGWGSTQRAPIFIVGLPRSGSTLLEQMLASHSQVEGTHELHDVAAIAFELWSRASAAERANYPQPVAALRQTEVAALAERYLERTRPYRALGRARFVDKMLGNFSHLGFIQLLFPNAAIIDARRHPLACGFSCYKQLFIRGQKFTYDLAELGRYYRDYVALMAEFDAALPGRVHRVHYERLVADPETELRRLLDYCGLQFEEQCLRFYENPRVVQTLSSEQVRQPIYTDSLEQWRHYEPWLGPLREALGDLVARYPAA